MSNIIILGDKETSQVITAQFLECARTALIIRGIRTKQKITCNVTKHQKSFSAFVSFPDLKWDNDAWYLRQAMIGCINSVMPKLCECIGMQAIRREVSHAAPGYSVRFGRG